MKRKLPDTSLAAYDALHPDQLREMYNKIVNALKQLGSGTYEEISDFLNCQDRNMISRRLKEMMPSDEDNPKGLNLIWKPGSKRPTKRGRSAYVYQLTGTQPKTEVQTEHIYKKNEKSAADYANEIIETVRQTYVQQTLL